MTNLVLFVLFQLLLRQLCWIFWISLKIRKSKRAKITESCLSQSYFLKEISFQKGNNLIAFYSNKMTQLKINLQYFYRMLDTINYSKIFLLHRKYCTTFLALLLVTRRSDLFLKLLCHSEHIWPLNAWMQTGYHPHIYYNMFRRLYPSSFVKNQLLTCSICPELSNEQAFLSERLLP